ncbi:MAG: ATPase, T2SS/T4P/T4SS family, partial [Candidatus Sericytochromatia bacterium]
MNQPVSVKPSPLPIGELLVREGVLSPALVAKILQRQEQNAATGRTHKLFGQICVEMQLVKSAQLQKFLAKYHKRILLGELLVCLDLLTPPQLQQTLAIQKKYPKHKFGAILVKLGALTETQLTDALSQQLDIPKILPTPEAGVSNLLGSLDPEFVRQNLFFPVSAGEDQVTVAMEDPQNQALIEYLFQSFSRRVVPVIAPATQLKAVIEEYIEHYHARKKSKPQLTSIGPLEISIDAQREIDKAGRTHGLGFLDTQEFQGITPPRVAEPAKAQTPDQQAVPEQTLIERWPFLLVDKAAEAQGQANQPAGPSIDEILMQKFGMSEDMDMQSTFILSSQPTQVSSPDSVQLANRLLDQLSQQNVDLRSTLKFETQQLDLQSTLVLPGAQQAPATAETENPQSTSADPAAAAATPAEAESEEEETDLEDTLIVGKISLASSRSQFRQEEGMLNYLIKSALLDQATAIYIEPQGLFMRVRYRIDGVLHQKTALPPNLGLPMLARLKQLCALNPENTATPQRNRVQARFNQSEIELSIATYPSISGESLALNFKYKLDASQSVPLNLAGIGLSPLYLWRL